MAEGNSLCSMCRGQESWEGRNCKKNAPGFHLIAEAEEFWSMGLEYPYHWELTAVLQQKFASYWQKQVHRTLLAYYRGPNA